MNDRVFLFDRPFLECDFSRINRVGDIIRCTDGNWRVESAENGVATAVPYPVAIIQDAS